MLPDVPESAVARAETVTGSDHHRIAVAITCNHPSRTVRRGWMAHCTYLQATLPMWIALPTTTIGAAGARPGLMDNDTFDRDRDVVAIA